MQAVYKRGVRYICHGLVKEFAEPMCASMDGPSIEALVVQAFFDAIQPAQLDALEALLAQRHQERGQVERNWEQQLQRATYEAQMARRRYESVDPGNRLVAAELEHRWEEKLVALRETQEAAERFRQEPAAPDLDPKLRRQLEHIAQHLPDLWNSGELTNEHKKQLLRSLIARVILTRVAPDRSRGQNRLGERTFLGMHLHAYCSHQSGASAMSPATSKWSSAFATLWTGPRRRSEIAAV